jgi:hypothetical protein
MKNSSLEITDNEYLIKLNKNDFDLSNIYRLLKALITESPALKSSFEHEEDLRSHNLSHDNASRFDSLSDK